MDEVTKDYFTVPEIAAIEGLTPNQVNYVLLRFHIKPADQFGGIRVFSAKQLHEINAAMSQVKFRNRAKAQEAML